MSLEWQASWKQMLLHAVPLSFVLWLNLCWTLLMFVYVILFRYFDQDLYRNIKIMLTIAVIDLYLGRNPPTPFQTTCHSIKTISIVSVVPIFMYLQLSCVTLKVRRSISDDRVRKPSSYRLPESSNRLGLELGVLYLDMFPWRGPGLSIYKEEMSWIERTKTSKKIILEDKNTETKRTREEVKGKRAGGFKNVWRQICLPP